MVKSMKHWGPNTIEHAAVSARLRRDPRAEQLRSKRMKLDLKKKKKKVKFRYARSSSDMQYRRSMTTMEEHRIYVR